MKPDGNIVLSKEEYDELSKKGMAYDILIKLLFDEEAKDSSSSYITIKIEPIRKIVEVVNEG